MEGYIQNGASTKSSLERITINVKVMLYVITEAYSLYRTFTTVTKIGKFEILMYSPRLQNHYKWGIIVQEENKQAFQ